MGKRDRRVLIQQVTDSTGTSGAPIGTWTTLTTEWMAKEDTRGLERLQAMQIAAKFDTYWEMPYRADMDPDLVDVPKKRRLVYESRVYDIKYATVINRRDGIQLQTLAGTRVA